MSDSPKGNPSDLDLLRRFAAGERSALLGLSDRHEAALLGLAQGLLSGDRDAAKDVVQETWVRVIRSARYFQGGSSVKTWLYRIVINRCLDVRRAEAARASAMNGKRIQIGEQATTPAVRNLEPDERVRQGLERLAPDQRLALLVCFHHGLSHREAADVLDWPLGTLKSRVEAALEALRKDFAKAGEP